MKVQTAYKKVQFVKIPTYAWTRPCITGLRPSPPSALDLVNSLVSERVPAAGFFKKICKGRHFIVFFPQEHVAHVIKPCNGTELILPHFNSHPQRGFDFVFLKPTLVICESPAISQGLLSLKQAVARCLRHILFTLCHFFAPPPHSLCGGFQTLSLSLSVSLCVSLFYILKLSVSWQRDNREATQHVERRDPPFPQPRPTHTHAYSDTHTCL